MRKTLSAALVAALLFCGGCAGLQLAGDDAELLKRDVDGLVAIAATKLDEAELDYVRALQAAANDWIDGKSLDEAAIANLEELEGPFRAALARAGLDPFAVESAVQLTASIVRRLKKSPPPPATTAPEFPEA